MTSWRKLMTPLYDKFYAQDSGASSLTQSRADRETPKNSTVRDSVSSPYANDKIAKLQNEMARLKFELNKYPSSQKKRTETASTTTNSGKKLTFPYDEGSSPIKGIISGDVSSNTKVIREIPETPKRGSSESNLHDSDSQRNEHNEIEFEPSAKKNFETTKSRARDLMEDYGLFKDEPVVSPKKGIPQKKETHSVELKRDKKTNSSMKKQVTTNINARNEAKEPSNKLQNMLTEKPKRRVEKKAQPESDKKDLNESLRMALTDCQHEIGELKEIVLHSKRKIDTLQDELEKEKKKSHKLRKELQKASTINPFRKGALEVTETSDAEESVGPIPINNQPTKRPKNTLSVDVNDSDSEKNGQIAHFSGNNTKEPLSNTHARMPMPSDMLKYGKEPSVTNTRKSQSIPTSTRNTANPTPYSFISAKDILNKGKEMGIQCDFFLEDIADNSKDEEIEKLKDEIRELKHENRNLKVEKNKMIDTMQTIILTLGNSSSSNAKAKVEVVKGEFGDFYNEYKRKLIELSQQNLARPSHHHEPSQNNTTMFTQIMKSRHVRGDTSDNLIYSPSADIGGMENSDYDPLIESYKQVSHHIIRVDFPGNKN